MVNIETINTFWKIDGYARVGFDTSLDRNFSICFKLGLEKWARDRASVSARASARAWFRSVLLPVFF